MRTQRTLIATFALLSLLCWSPVAHALVPAAQAPVLQQDAITVGSVTASSGTVSVPVYIRDVSGTPLGLDQPAGSKLQSYSIKVDFSPAASVTGATFAKAGVTAALTPSFQANPQSPGSSSWIITFPESTNQVPYTLDGAVPGNQVGTLTVQLASNVTAGSTVTMTIDPTLSQVANDAGTTSETVNAGNLLLVGGVITIPAGFVYNVPTLSQLALALLALSLAVIAIRSRM